MEDGDIYRYGVKTIRGRRRGSDFQERITNSLLPLFELMGDELTIVIERIDKHAKSRGLKAVMSHALKSVARPSDSVVGTELAEVKRSLCGSEKATHQALVETVANRYPMFWPLITHKKSHTAKYWEKALMAVALALAAFEQLEANRKAEGQ